MRSEKGRTRELKHAKANGVHYTPPDLAAFLADAVVKVLHEGTGPLRVLDPACGYGELLLAFVQSVPIGWRERLILEGYETDALALARAGTLLANTGARAVVLKHQDFLGDEGMGCCAEDGAEPSLFGAEGEEGLQRFDAVIANPPYVRTQVLGAEKAQGLASKFSLTGRVDLYHAFTKAMSSVLKPGGALGLLTSNRFLTVKSGASLRQLLTAQFDLEAIYDLGDTKLFSAAVLPVVVVGRKGKAGAQAKCIFDRIYEHRSSGSETKTVPQHSSVLAALRDRGVSGVIGTPGGTFCIQRGTLDAEGETWSLSTGEVEKWLAAVRQRQAHCFGELCKVRVGVKTTADEVFIRDDWDSLPAEARPEDELLRPLLTHFNASPWFACSLPKLRRILYPHTIVEGRQTAVSLADYPRGTAYLNSHRTRLERREYVTGAGRQWYEIWVPHRPDDWPKLKIVFPDISECPRFFLDASGAVVNGDCYWITLNRGVEPAWLLLMLAVANSTFITQYYDTVFHNKLYSGRRRFMTQYVANFPLPDADSPVGRKIVCLVTDLLERRAAEDGFVREIDALVWESFGLAKEV